MIMNEITHILHQYTSQSECDQLSVSIWVKFSFSNSDDKNTLKTFPMPQFTEYWVLMFLI